MPATQEDLQRIAEFDHVFTVTDAGQLEDGPSGIYAPEVYHDDRADIDLMGARGWEALTGYTGQHGYRGAVMHSSEYLGGRLADDILSTPGVYVVTTVEVYPMPIYPHSWSPSGARCTRCPVAGTGDPDNDGNCTGHPDYDPARDDERTEEEPAGWAILRRTEV